MAEMAGDSSVSGGSRCGIACVRHSYHLCLLSPLISGHLQQAQYQSWRANEESFSRGADHVPHLRKQRESEGMHNDKFRADDGCASGHSLHSPRARRKIEAVATYIENSAAHALRRLS